MIINSIIEKPRNIGFVRYLFVALSILIILIFLLRNTIVRYIFDDKCSSIKNRYGLSINVDKIGFSGIRTIYLENLTVKPEGRDTLFCISRAEVKLNLIDLIFLKINPLEIWLDNPKVNLIGNKHNSNFSYLTGSHNDIQQINGSNGYQATKQNAIYRTVKAIFGLTTAKYHVHNFTFCYSDSLYTSQIIAPEFESTEKGFNTQIETRENGDTSFINLNGLADKKRSSITLKALMIGEKKPLPLLNHKFGVDISFDTLVLKIEAKRLNKENIHLVLNSSVSSLNLFSQRISDQIVKTRHCSFNIDLLINSDYYLIDSSSTFDLNGLKANLFLKYIPSKDRYINLKVSTGTFQSQQLFDALPEGLFNNLRGIKTNGDINYCLDLGVMLNKPDSVRLIPMLITKNFGIAQYGLSNFSALNDTFSHDVYDEGRFIRTIHLGERNKNYKSLDQISPFIIDAIVTSEDGGFFSNNGFDIDALKYAISENIKQKRFVRGGSTITMQLIKNLYLNKNKNLFRKAEEYLIVWLIGSQGIVSKDRMLEIYLNIIEWGPGVYGVNEACHYYFNKDPKAVTVDEAIYLASVIPRPKKFKYLFERDGNLKPFMEGDFTFIANKMLQRDMISEDQFNSLVYNVKLKGKAKEMLIDTLSFPIDSISLDEIRLNRDTTLLSP